MPDSSATAVLLPFGSLMGTVPVDALARGRVLGDLNNVLGSSDQLEIQRSVHSAIDPGLFVPRSRRPSE